MPTPAATHFATQLNGIDMAAFVLAVLGLLFLMVWGRDRSTRLAWLALSFLMMASFFVTDRWHQAHSPYVDRSAWTLFIETSLVFMVLGVVDSLHIPNPWHKRAFWILSLPYLAWIALILSGVPLLRQWHNMVIMFTHFGMATLAFYAARREPGAGHGVIAAALLSLPLMALVLMLAQVDPVALRYFAPMPMILLGMTLLVVTLERRRRKLADEVLRRKQAESDLRSLNASLERQVHERTADLQNIVVGLESFNRTVSHDLRGPLGGMAELAQLAHEALNRHDDSLARAALPVIAQQARDSASLVQALLSLAQVGEAPFSAAPTDLQRVVQDTIRQLSITHPDWPVGAIQVHALPTAQADAALLRPIFSNLIGNALKFTRHQHAPTIDISAQHDGEQIVVQIKDNGMGFDQHAAHKLFEPFVRLHDRSVEGHGVGLSIVRRAVERHGGRVWAEARPDEGASFYFTLPLRHTGIMAA